MANNAGPKQVTMERCASWVRLSTIAPLTACILLAAHRGALGAPTPDAEGVVVALPDNVVTRDEMAVYIARAFERPG